VEQFGYVSRMDTVQAAILEYRLSQLSQMIESRRKNAEMYKELLHSSPVYIPEERELEFNTYHTFVIQCDRRNELRNYLLEQGIETAIHYPVPIHLQPAASYLGYIKGDFPVTEAQSQRILTLPIHPYLQENTIINISNCIKAFYKFNANRN